MHGGVNRFEGDKNFDLLNLALDCTSSKMMPNLINQKLYSLVQWKS